MKRREYLLHVAPAGGVAAVGLVLHVPVFGGDLLTFTSLLFGLVAATVATFAATRRVALTAAVPAALAVWGPLHTAPLAGWLGFLVVTGLLFLPAAPRPAESVIAATGAAAATFLLLRSPFAAAVAGVAAAGLAVLRPRMPTRDHLHAIALVALWLPPGSVVAALVLNAVTQKADTLRPLAGLGWGIGFAGIGVLGGLALLGLRTYVESSDPRQAGAWMAASAAAAVILGAATSKDASIVSDGVMAGGAALFLLTALFGERLRKGRAVPVALAVTVAASLLFVGW